ncbi:MAG: hypothetical protein HY648_07570 [Acidobacteria bacterium]|nr:hypothetical protein [Acidobacteriota bacterium]
MRDARQQSSGNSYRPARERFLMWRSIAGLLCCLAAVSAPAQIAADSPATISFTKEFPNSEPAYYEVTVRQDGTASYRTAPDDEKPLQFQVPSETAQDIFSLAQKLNRFREAKLESKRRVASLGKKTLAYSNGAEQYAATFNHTEVPEAAALATLFERISQTQQHSLKLEYLLRFDRLGIMKGLLQLEADLDQGRLLNASQLLPQLEKIRDNKSLVQVAQTRAAQIIAKIEASPQR